MCDENMRLPQGKKCLGSLPLKIANHPLCDVLDIKRPLAQIRVVDLAQGLRVTRCDFLEHPLYIAKIGLKFSQNFIDQRAIFDHQQVRIENSGVLCANRFSYPLLHLKNLHARLNKRRLEAPDLICNLG